MSKVEEYELGLIRTDRGEHVDKGNIAVDPTHPDFAGRKDIMNGVVDATEAFQAADTYAQLYGLDLILRPGTYSIQSALTLTSGIRIPRGATLKPASGVTVTINGQLDAGTYKVFDTSAGGSIAFGDGAVEQVSMRWWGAVGDGATDDYTAFNTADAAGRTHFVPSGTYLINTNLTLDGSYVFVEGAKLKPASGVTITINGPLDAGLYQVFDASAGGTIAFGDGATEEVFPQWWGAKGDGVNEDASAIQDAIDATSSASVCVRFVKGTYLIDTQLTVSGVRPVLEGDGHSSILKASAAITTIFNVTERHTTVRELRLWGFNNATLGVTCSANDFTITGCRVESCVSEGIRLSDNYACLIDRNWILDNPVGIRLLNSTFPVNISTIRGNIIENGGVGVRILNASSGSYQARVISIYDNTFQTLTSAGIQIENPCDLVEIRANWFEANGSATGSDIRLTGASSRADSLKIIGNLFALTDANSPASLNLVPGVASSGLMIVGNKWENNSGTLDISLGSNWSNYTILDNTLHKGTNARGAQAVRFPTYTNAARPAAGTAGRAIFNTDDGQLNIDDGTNWTLPDGTTT